MPRRPREEEPGAVHHVYARGNDRRRVFADNADRYRYLSLLGSSVERFRWRCLAFCLMPNHVHLLIETPEPNLGVGMQRLQGRYAARFNQRHGRGGHVFQGRYGSVRVESDAQLWAVVRYIARNPVEAGLARTPADFRWSSSRVLLEGDAPGWLETERLLDYVAAAGGDARRRLAALVNDEGPLPGPLDRYGCDESGAL